jgi:hypothetical protein
LLASPMNNNCCEIATFLKLEMWSMVKEEQRGL